MAEEPPEDQPDVADVRATYDHIAEHFAATREYAWPEVEAFLDDVAEAGDDDAADESPVHGSRLGLDVGCGNGRHVEAMRDVVDRAVGVDVSRCLLATAVARAANRGYDASTDWVMGDAARLPVTDDVVDVAVYVATLHHLPTREARVASLDELGRVLAPGGRALVTAWSVAHDRFDRAVGHDTTVDWTLPEGETIPRFYHVYDREEFERDLERAALVVRDVRTSSGNCYAVVGSA
jgi:tRNA (uracil-5-)-methyltransferase TRM9